MAQLNKYQKEIESLLSKSEKDVSKELKALYDDLIKEVTAETVKLQKEIAENDKFSKKLQKDRLDSIRSQMQVKSDQLASKQHDSMFKFLKKGALTSYNELFYDFEMSNKMSVAFSLLPDKQIATIINTPVAGRKLSTRLKGNSTKMKQNMNSVLSRGFAQGWSTQKMAVQIQETGGSTYRRAMTIARTEAGRVTSVTRQQSQNHAKELGIDFDKQWISTLDLKTRSDHRGLDGQIVGVDEYFKVSGYKALQPHMFGVASEDCNCRCRTISKLKGHDLKQRRDNESHEVIDYKNYGEWFADKYPDMVKQSEKGYNVVEKVANKLIFKEVTNDILDQLQEDSNAWISDLTQSEYVSVDNFTDTWYDDMNGLLRDPNYDSSDDDYVYTNIQNFEKALDKYKLSENIVAYRGVSEAEYKAILKGSSFDEFKSLSTDKQVADKFTYQIDETKGVIVKFNVPKGSSGAYIGENSASSSESEFTLNRGTTYTAVETDDGLEVTINGRKPKELPSFEHVDD